MGYTIKVDTLCCCQEDAIVFHYDEILVIISIVQITPLTVYSRKQFNYSNIISWLADRMRKSNKYGASWMLREQKLSVQVSGTLKNQKFNEPF